MPNETTDSSDAYRPNGQSISVEKEAVRLVEIAEIARKNRLYAAEYRERGEWVKAHACDRTALQLDAVYRGATLTEFPQPCRKPGGKPCGECHIAPGEVCDICGAFGDKEQETNRDV